MARMNSEETLVNICEKSDSFAFAKQKTLAFFVLAVKRTDLSMVHGGAILTRSFSLTYIIKYFSKGSLSSKYFRIGDLSYPIHDETQYTSSTYTRGLVFS